jgi:cytochrome bd-type quinol oxidase subunit 2
MTSSMSATSAALALIALIAVKLTHLQALVIFALVISVAFGFLGRRQPKERVKYILWTLLLFLLVGVGIGWAMYPFSH